jgi:hypothetical protein
MKRYTKILLWMAILFSGGALLPPEAEIDTQSMPSHHCDEISSQPVVPVAFAICDPVYCRGRISSGLVPTGWFDGGLKNNRYETAFHGFFSQQQNIITHETTLFSFDCMLQI